MRRVGIVGAGAVLAASCLALAPEGDDCGDSSACPAPLTVTLSPPLAANTYEFAFVVGTENCQCTVEFADTGSTHVDGGDEPGSGLCMCGDISIEFPRVGGRGPLDTIEFTNPDVKPASVSITVSQSGNIVANGSFNPRYTRTVDDPCLQCSQAEVVLQTVQP